MTNRATKTSAAAGVTTRESMDGKVCLVTGPTSGIGLATARGLAERGATVVMACRDTVKGGVIARKIAAETGSTVRTAYIRAWCARVWAET